MKYISTARTGAPGQPCLVIAYLHEHSCPTSSTTLPDSCWAGSRWRSTEWCIGDSTSYLGQAARDI
eukprot:1151673-Pelagomonas_calceolata.AAC.10